MVNDGWYSISSPDYGYIYSILIDYLLLELGYYIYPKKNINDHLYYNNNHPFIFYKPYYSQNISEYIIGLGAHIL